MFSKVSYLSFSALVKYCTTLTVLYELVVISVPLSDVDFCLMLISVCLSVCLLVCLFVCPLFFHAESVLDRCKLRIEDTMMWTKVGLIGDSQEIVEPKCIDHKKISPQSTKPSHFKWQHLIPNGKCRAMNASINVRRARRILLLIPPLGTRVWNEGGACFTIASSGDFVDRLELKTCLGASQIVETLREFRNILYLMDQDRIHIINQSASKSNSDNMPIGWRRWW